MNLRILLTAIVLEVAVLLCGVSYKSTYAQEAAVIDIFTLLSIANASYGITTDNAGNRTVNISGPLVITGLHDTLIDGGGSEIRFTDPNPSKGGMRAIGWQRVTIRNLILGWTGDPGYWRDTIKDGSKPTDVKSYPERRIRSFGEVQRCSDPTMGGFISLEDSVDANLSVAAITVWDSKSGWPWNLQGLEKPEIYFPTGNTLAFKRGNSSCIKALSGMVGEKIMVRHFVYANHAFVCWGCGEIKIEHVTVDSAPGMAFVFERGGHDLSLVENQIVPRCKPVCDYADQSVAADGAHFAAVGDDIVIEGNDFGWQGDDSVNVTGLLVEAVFEGCAGAAEMIECGFRATQRATNRINEVKANAVVTIYDLGLNPIIDGRVQKSEAGLLTLVPTAPFPNLPNGGRIVISEQKRVPKNIKIRGNWFHDHRARGILAGGSNTLIESNTIERVTMAAILIPADTDHWFEGPGAHGVVIRKNKIKSANAFRSSYYPSAISAGFRPGVGAPVVGEPITDLRIEDNEFSDIRSNASTLVSFGTGVKRVITSNNLLH